MVRSYPGPVTVRPCKGVSTGRVDKGGIFTASPTFDLLFKTSTVYRRQKLCLGSWKEKGTSEQKTWTPRSLIMGRLLGSDWDLDWARRANLSVADHLGDTNFRNRPPDLRQNIPDAGRVATVWRGCHDGWLGQAVHAQLGKAVERIDPLVDTDAQGTSLKTNCIVNQAGRT